MIIACGTGPSYWHTKLPDFPRIGCSIINDGIDYYAYSELTHQEHVPTHVPVFAHPRVWRPGMILWDANLKYGNTSGGMAVAVACTLDTEVGLIGFDGTDVPQSFKNSFIREVLRDWTLKGITFYSLMEESFINDSGFATFTKL